MSKKLIQAIKNGKTESKFSGIVKILPKEPICRKDIAAIWLTDEELEKCAAEYYQLFVDQKPTLVPPRALRILWDLIQPKYKSDGTVQVLKMKTWRWTQAEPVICAKMGYESITLRPAKGCVNTIIIENKTIEQAEHDTKMAQFRGLLRKKYPHIEYAISCRFEGPCGLLKRTEKLPADEFHK